MTPLSGTAKVRYMVEQGKKDLLARYDAFLIDVDGVLWLEGEALPGAAETLKELDRLGKRTIFLTNKSTGSRKEIAEKLQKAGLPVPAGRLVTSAFATAVYLREKAGTSRVYALGSPGFLEELTSEGHTLTSEAPRFVAVGFVPLSELKRETLQLVRSLVAGGASLVACNLDRGNPLPDGTFSLGSYYTVKTVEKAAGKRALVVGKPYRPIFDITCRLFGLDKSRSLLVGDSLQADVAGGKNAGIRTALVLTGFSTTGDLAASKIKPDVVLPSLADLLP